MAAAYLDSAGTLLLLYRSGCRPLVFKTCFDLIKIGSQQGGPIYVNDMSALYQRIRETCLGMLKEADVRVRSSGGIGTITMVYSWHGIRKPIRFISAAALNMPDGLNVSDKLDYIETLKAASGFYPYSIGAAASKYFSIHADLTPGAELTPDQRALARSAFFGGFCYLRPGVYEVRDGYVYDINKLYAFILRDKPLPIGKPKEYVGEIPGDSKGFYIHRFKCSARLKSGKLPFIRLIHDWADKTGYQTAINDKILTLSKPDFELFKANYKLLSYEPIGGLDFYVCDLMFKLHVSETFDKIRKSDRPGVTAAYKILINALFGQYGRKDIKGRVVFKDGCFEWDPDYQRISNSYIPEAVAIAAYGRSILIPAAQREGSNFIYSDTDSIHTFRPSRYIKTSKEFGEFKLEEHYDHGRYFGRRKYALLLSAATGAKKIVMAGLPSGSLDRVPYEDIRRGYKVPISRRFLQPDGSVNKVNMFYQI